jgi:sec-independent protein translocase protein TatB
MDILGIGFPELLLILIIAMMVFGPRRLPEMAAKAGKIVRDMRGMSQGLLLEWQREINVATRLDELSDLRQELELAKQELSDTTRDVGQQAAEQVDEVKKDVASIPPTVNRAVGVKSNDGAASTTTKDKDSTVSAPADSVKQSKEDQPEQPAGETGEATAGAGAETAIEDRTIDPRPEATGAPVNANPGSGSTTDSQNVDSELAKTNGKSEPDGSSDEQEPPTPDSSQASVTAEPEEATNE